MYHVLSVDEIRLPSTNHKYYITRKGLIPTRQYRETKKKLEDMVMNIEIPSPYHVKIEVQTYSDIDNNLKIILDSLKNRCIDDDKNILKLTVIKKNHKRGRAGFLNVWVETIDPKTLF
jgi:Holliday junction resolvase RusA-like endonuclease